MKSFVRKAHANDSEIIATLSNQLGYKANCGEIETRLEALVQLKDHCVFVAVMDERVIGWVHGFYALRVESPPFVEIAGLVIDENFRKKGVGKMLVEAVGKWSQSINCQTLRIRCNTIRKESHNFYNRIGFREIKEQKVFERIIN